MNQIKEILKADGISKRFLGTQALDNVSLSLRTGRITALIGENGAGKSTLVKILAGYYSSDAGTLKLHGEEIVIESVTHAQNLGISVIHQVPSFASDLSVVDNLFLGREISSHKRLGRIAPFDLKKEIQTVTPYIELYGGGFKPQDKMKDLKAYQQRLVGIIKALIFSSSILIMDEPTAALPMEERDILLSKIVQLKEEGYSILYVSHHLDEIERIADDIVALRDGHLAGYVKKIPGQSEMIEMMTGNRLTDISFLYEKRKSKKDSSTLHNHKFSYEPPTISNINYVVREPIELEFLKGSIISLSGLVGSGTKELAESMFGIYPDWSVFYSANGSGIRIDNPRTAIKTSIGYLSDDRIGEATIPDFSIRKNITLPKLEKISTRVGQIRKKKERVASIELCETLKVKMNSIEQLITALSGGNQQKVMLARWLFSEVKFLILNEPTQGIDVLAKQDVVKLLTEFSLSGGTCLIATNDPEEFLHVSDRVIVMKRGKIAGDFTNDEISREKIQEAMLIN